MGTTSLVGRVTDCIFAHIRERHLKSGDKLPSELRISADLKISRGIVREAFRSLSAAGIIEVGAGRSPRVGALNSVFLTHLMLHALSTRQVSPEQVLDLRGSVEVHAAELAAQRRSDQDTKQLRGAVAGMKKSLRDPHKFVLHDIRFHQIVNGATGNPLFPIIGGAMRECMEKSILAGLESRTARGQLVQIVETHSAIVDAIEAGNSAHAGQLMRVHFDEAKNALREYFLRVSVA
jgi:GntR family transcriptional regulator, transcriptional repressor for pyruvate dehydrogenase complex